MANPLSKKDVRSLVLAMVALVVFVCGSYFLIAYTSRTVPIDTQTHNSSPDAIRDTVLQNGGVYFEADATASPEDIAAMYADKGLTHKDGASQTLTLRQGITVTSTVLDPHIPHAYHIKTAKRERGAVSVSTAKVPLAIKIIAGNGELVGVSLESDSSGTNRIEHVFNAGEEYLVEIFLLDDEKNPSFDPQKGVRYTISYKRLP